MFESLQERLSDVFDKLRRRGALSEEDVSAALREVRIALLEADVALPVVKDFIDGVRAKAIGQEVLRSVSPGQMVIKISMTTWSRRWAPRPPRSTPRWRRRRS